jgi:hypothetical protein
MATISEDKLKRLQQFLVTLGDGELHALTRAIEYGRSHNFQDIPAAKILEMIRPALVEIRPKHIPTRDRVLCEPCEDLFISYMPDVKREALIERKSITPFVKKTHALLGDKLDAVEKEMIEDFKMQRWNELELRKSELWELADEVWRAELAAKKSGEARKALLVELGGTDRYEDILEAVACLQVANSIRDVRLLYPNRPIVRLKKELVEALVAVLSEANDAKPEAAEMVVWTIHRRLKTKTDIMTIFRSMDATKTVWCDGIQQVRDRIEKSLLQELDATADDLATAIKRGRIAPDALFNELETYLDEMDRLKSSTSRGNAEATKAAALRHIRSISSLVDETVIRSAKKTVTPTIETLLTLVESGSEFTDDVLDMIEKAERIALSFKRVDGIADRIGAKSSFERERQVLDKMLIGSENRLKLWLDQNHASKPELAEESVLYFCRLIEIVSGSKRAKDAKHRLFVGLAR